MHFYMFYLLNKQVVIYLDKKSIIRADRIKALLKENGLTMKFFNDKFGKNRSFLSNVLSGSDNIDEAQIEFLAEKLNTTPEYLKGETDIKEKPATTQDDELISALEDPQIMKLVKRLYDVPKEERDRLERIIDAALGNPK